MATDTMLTQKLYLNGLDASTGEYLVPDGYLTPNQILPVARREKRTPDEVKHSKEKALPEAKLALKRGLCPVTLSDAGWAVIWSPDVHQDVKDALKPLLNRRRDKAGDRYCEYPDQKHSVGFQPDMDCYSFLANYGVLPGAADPAKMPYYLLIVGDPKTIPFSFQHQLDVDRAVGRLHFATPDEYGRYAQSVVDAETSDALPNPRAAFFSVTNPDDESTQLSHELLMSELFKRLTSEAGLAAKWAFDFVPPEEAKKPKLAEYLGGTRTPELLFTASHGAGFGKYAPDYQRERQGALVCGEWPGPVKWKEQGGGPIPETSYFCAQDVDKDAKVAGMIAIFFACYGAGTPELNDFVHRRDLLEFEKTTVAKEPFVSGLARRLLAHPRGGALAIVGHVDRAWDTAFTEFMWQPAPGAQQRKMSAPDVFDDLLRDLLDGKPVGLAMESMNMRYASLSTLLTNEFDNARKSNKRLDAANIAPIWTANNDARNYVIIGDPFVKLSLA